MPKAIARISKLKASNIAASEQHTTRQRDTLNADPAKHNIRLIGGSDLQDSRLEVLVRHRIGDQPTRKNAVLCVEMLLTVSPDYFRPHQPGQAGRWDDTRLERFQWAVQQWLSEQYSDRIVRAELHLDEATPHIHAYLVPIDERGHLNCYGLFGDREKLRQFQDSYAKALEPLGIERGIRGSRATHTAIQEYYAAVEQEPDLTMDLETIHHQLADRQRALKERNEMEQTARALERENERLKHQIQQQQKLLEQYQATDQDFDLSLERIVCELGLEYESTLQQWRGRGCTLEFEGYKFHDWQQETSGSGAISLVMHVCQIEFTEAMIWLRDRFGESVALQCISEASRQIFQSKPMRSFTLPESSERHWQTAKSFLTRSLKFPTRLIDQLHQQGLIYAHSSQELVFVYRSLDKPEKSGAIVYSLEQSIWQRIDLAQGWFYLCPQESSKKRPERIVLVDSPTEAIAKYLLEKPQKMRSLYLAVNKNMPSLSHQLQAFSEIVLAYDPSHHQDLLQQVSPEAACVIQTPQTGTWQTDLVNSLMQGLSEDKLPLKSLTRRTELEL